MRNAGGGLMNTAQPPSRSIDGDDQVGGQAEEEEDHVRRGAPAALMISRKVWAFGARRLTSMARMPKRRIWTVAPAAYQKGPVMPYCHATFEDWRRVAAHVHCETITEPVRPVLTLRPRC